MSLRGQEPTLLATDSVPAKGQKAKFRDDQRTPALASKADISRLMSNALVCNGHRGLVSGL
jgi:hypothetical protein